MRFGVREICEVVLKAKGTQKVGNKTFFKDEPVIYFDSLKTSSLEGAATTVYATGGRGNSRLIAWEGERTLTFNMEDALISPVSFAILSGAGLIDASEDNKIYVHTTETTDKVEYDADAQTGGVVTITLSEPAYNGTDGNYVYVMVLKEGEVVTEPYIPSVSTDGLTLTIDGAYSGKPSSTKRNDMSIFAELGDGNIVVLVDYYVEKTSAAQQIDITPDQFGGNYYLEASTLFRDQSSGQDWPAEFIIPNCKVQSNFTFTMAASGDPSTFNFVLDAFPDYTRFNKTKKVLAAIQIIEPNAGVEDAVRTQTYEGYTASASN